MPLCPLAFGSSFDFQIPLPAAAFAKRRVFLVVDSLCYQRWLLGMSFSFEIDGRCKELIFVFGFDCNENGGFLWDAFQCGCGKVYIEHDTPWRGRPFPPPW